MKTVRTPALLLSRFARLSLSDFSYRLNENKVKDFERSWMSFLLYYLLSSLFSLTSSFHCFPIIFWLSFLISLLELISLTSMNESDLSTESSGGVLSPCFRLLISSSLDLVEFEQVQEQGKKNDRGRINEIWLMQFNSINQSKKFKVEGSYSFLMPSDGSQLKQIQRIKARHQ